FGILAPENDLFEFISAMVRLDTVCLEQNTVFAVVLSETFEVAVMGVEGEVVPAEFLCVLFEVGRQRKLLHPIHTKLKSVLGDCFWVVGEVHQPSILDIPTIVHGQERGSHGGVILHCSSAVLVKEIAEHILGNGIKIFRVAIFVDLIGKLG